MRNSRAFTLIELMVVILIVAILAAVLVPMLTGRIESARYSEAKAGCGQIATAIRGYYAEHQDEAAPLGALTMPATGVPGSLMSPTDLNGKYFINTDYAVSITTATQTDLGFTIDATPSLWTPTGIQSITYTYASNAGGAATSSFTETPVP